MGDAGRAFERRLCVERDARRLEGGLDELVVVAEAHRAPAGRLGPGGEPRVHGGRVGVGDAAVVDDHAPRHRQSGPEAVQRRASAAGGEHHQAEEHGERGEPHGSVGHRIGGDRAHRKFRILRHAPAGQRWGRERPQTPGWPLTHHPFSIRGHASPALEHALPASTGSSPPGSPPATSAPASRPIARSRRARGPSLRCRRRSRPRSRRRCGRVASSSSTRTRRRRTRRRGAGKHVVVATPTASGKSLCFHLPVLEALAREPDAARSTSIRPRRWPATRRRGCAQLIAEAGLAIPAVVYDGDTPGDARRAARERSPIVMTNPDMIHAGILPHHAHWARTFQKLRYVVLDELHTYRGVFGSHVAHVIARLRRAARFHGSEPDLPLRHGHHRQPARARRAPPRRGARARSSWSPSRARPAGSGGSSSTTRRW